MSAKRNVPVPGETFEVAQRREHKLDLRPAGQTFTVVLPEGIAGWLFDQCDSETEFWIDVLEDERRTDEHQWAREAIADWQATKANLIKAGMAPDVSSQA